MTREDIIRIVQKAHPGHAAEDMAFFNRDSAYIKALEGFATLVAAAEREEILKLTDSLGWVDANAIRARGSSL